MRYRIRQRFLSWFDSFDIYDENGDAAFTVQGKLSWGHCLHILDRNGSHIATVKERVVTMLPKFELYIHDRYVGMLRKKLTLFSQNYEIDFNGWQVDGDFTGWNYNIVDMSGREVAKIRKELLHLTDTYIIDVERDEDALCAIMLVIAIDAEKCTASKSS